MSTFDIRKGDLVKFTNKADPDVSVTTRILTRGYFNDVFYSKTLDRHISLAEWDAEVLERPVPEAEPELVQAVRDAYHTRLSAQDSWKAVIKTVREYDRDKESK